MSRLVNIGVGEMIDRLTILSLKILVGRERRKDVTHFETEQTALFQQIGNLRFTLTGSGFAVAFSELAAVNGQLWQAEDQLRAWRGEQKSGVALEVNWELIVTCAFRIQDLNDRRAALVRQINQLAGDVAEPEKL